MNPFGHACLTCRQRPMIRTDGLCAGCGEEQDTAKITTDYGPWLCEACETEAPGGRYQCECRDDKQPFGRPVLRRLVTHKIPRHLQSVRPPK